MTDRGLLLTILLIDGVWLVIQLGLMEVILKPFSMYVMSRGLEKIKPYYDRVKESYDLLDNSLMADNQFIEFMLESTDYVWKNVIPSVGKDMEEDEKELFVDYLVNNFDPMLFLEKVEGKHSSRVR